MMSPPALLVGLYAGAVLLLVLSIARERVLLAGALKILSSSLFLLLAWQQGVLSRAGGGVWAAALALCWLGDVLLLHRSKAGFLAGLGAFLLGQLGLAAAMLHSTTSLPSLLLGLLPVLPFSLLSWRWLSPKLSGAMRQAVRAYLLAISLMLGASHAAWAAEGSALWVSGAWLFALSDLAVARQRFMVSEPLNRMVGLPLYYLAVLLLILETAP